jgi:hypothetical protein
MFGEDIVVATVAVVAAAILAGAMELLSFAIARAGRRVEAE